MIEDIFLSDWFPFEYLSLDVSQVGCDPIEPVEKVIAYWIDITVVTETESEGLEEKDVELASPGKHLKCFASAHPYHQVVAGFLIWLIYAQKFSFHFLTQALVMDLESAICEVALSIAFEKSTCSHEYNV